MSATFDGAYYLNQYSDVLTAIVGGTFGAGFNTDLDGDGDVDNFDIAQYHFNMHGWAERRDPNSTFDTSAYLSSNSDVLAAGINPFSHFQAYGLTEGRAPNGSIPAAGNFDADAYLAANSDVSDAVDAGTFASAYQHYILHGQFEGRAAQTTGGQTITPTTNSGGSPGDTGTPGSTIPLTDNVEAVTGTEGDDTFIAANATYNTGDSVNGGGGTDRLNLTTTAAETDLVDLTSVEQVYLRNTNSGTAIDASGWSGVSQIWYDRGTQDMDVTGVAALATVGLNEGAGANSDFNVQFSSSVLSGSSDTLSVVTTSASIDDLDVGESTGTEEFETWAFTNTGTSTVATLLDGAGNAEDLSTVTATGTGSLTLTDALDANNDGITVTVTGALDFTGTTSGGNDTLTGGDGNDSFTTGAGNDTVNGGAGNDTVIFGGNLTTNDTADGGDGTDTIAASAAFTSAALTNVSNFERARFDADVDQDLSVLESAGFSTFVYNVTGTHVSTKNKDTFTHILTVDATDLAPVVVTDDLSNILIVELDDADLAGELGNASGSSAYETINLTSSGEDTGDTTNTVAAVDAASGATLTISGSFGLTISSSVNSIVANASSFTGKLGFTGSASADEITGGSGNDTIDGAGGNDTVTLTAGGNDIVDISTVTGVVTIDGFASGDVVDIEEASGKDGENVITAAQAAAEDPTTLTTQIVTINASTTSVLTGGSETISDFTDTTDVAAYLEEAFDIATTEEFFFVLNDGTNSYIYEVVEAGDTTIDAGETTLVGVVNGYVLGADDVSQTA
ncbi:hypothetical protein [uncultured Rhodospira sp.]|uniref:beta strand repeat-containing protein n=1 Tax=uncultured Rhodospira sp. TaxID=1936189 RepID=UPI00262EDD7F|nr:hypothetical protein [uncultured Rhodospira sp.]